MRVYIEPSELDPSAPMKPALIIITVVACLGLTGLFVHDVYQRNIAVEQSSNLVMTVTADILINWDLQTIHQHADDALLAGDSVAATQRRYTAMGRRLGMLEEIYDIEYELDMPGWWQVNATASASYRMRARFESEVATIRVELVRQQGRWMISVYDIQPPAIPA